MLTTMLYRLLTALLLALPAVAADRPNIVVILVDDMGFSDIGCYGSEIQTPHLDALAAGGLRFTEFYNTGRCCPTRAALLTGLYSHQAGIGHMSANDGLPGYTGALNDSTQTLAEVARSAGYFTAMAGKWHVGNKPGQMPNERGFDRFFGSDLGGNYYDLTTLGDARRLYLDHEIFAQNNRDLPEGFYSTHAFVDYSIRFIDEARQQDKPFFLYLAHIAPHFPLQAPEETIARYRGKYLAVWDKLAAERYARQVEMGLVWDWTPASRRT